MSSVIRSVLLPSGYFEWDTSLEHRLYIVYGLYWAGLVSCLFVARRKLRKSNTLSSLCLLLLWLSLPNVSTWSIEAINGYHPQCRSVTIVSPLLFNISSTLFRVHYYSSMAGDCGLNLSRVPRGILAHIEVLSLYFSTVLFYFSICGIQRLTNLFYSVKNFDINYVKLIVYRWVVIAAIWLVVLGVIFLS